MNDELRRMLVNLDAIRDEITRQWHVFDSAPIGHERERQQLNILVRMQVVKDWYKKRLIKKINEL